MTRTAAFLALLLVACSRGEPGKTYTMTAQSMEPTLRPGDRIGCTREAPGEIRRGDVVVFDGAGLHWTPIGTTQPRTFVQRVVGLPGETVAGGEAVLVNGAPLAEPYLAGRAVDSPFGPVTVDADTYFVMGDNRARSADSRVNGAVPRAALRGVCTRIVAPKERRGDIRGT